MDAFSPSQSRTLIAANAIAGAGFLPMGSIITEPAVGYGAALGLAFFHDSIENRIQKMKELTPDGRPPRLAPPSISGLFGMATENGTWGAGVFHFGVWKQDRIRYLGAVGLASVNMDFYGFGNHPELPVDHLSYNLEGGGTLQQLLFRVAESDLFLGAKYSLGEVEVSLDGAEAIIGMPLERTIRTGGAAAVIEYDSRNVIFTPDSGINARFEVMWYDEMFGSDEEFTIGEINLRTWIPIKRSWVLGLRADGSSCNGDTPFYMVPSIEIRGIPYNRYQGQHVITTEAELRWDFTKRWSLVGFVGSGWTAADEVSDFELEDYHVAGGAGFRYLLARAFGIRAGVDVAWSEDDTAIYLTSGHDW